MNVLSQAPAPGTAKQAGIAQQSTSAATALAQTGTASAPQQAFAQVWGQQAAQMLSEPLVAKATLPAESFGANVQTAPVVLGAVEPVVQWPAQHLPDLDVLALDQGEVEEPLLSEDVALPAMQNLSPLQVVHPQLRRGAVAAMEAQPAAGQLQGAITDAVVRTSAHMAAVADAASSAPVPTASTATAATSKDVSPSPLVQALGQRIQLQQAQGQDVVTVRLDPPQWGRIEIRIQQDAAGMQVVLQATHAEVGRQLTSVADALRQELQARTSGEASVVVAHSQRGMAGQGQGERHAQQGDEAWAGEAPVGQALQFDMGDGAV